MAIDPDLFELMTDEVSFFAFSTTDAYGKRSHSGTSTTIDCRLVYKNQMMRDMDGREVLSVGRAILNGSYTSITTNYKMQLPNGTYPPIVSVSHLNDEVGSGHHTVVYFGV